jgi:serine/threonine protein phosphatase PrpC
LLAYAIRDRLAGDNQCGLFSIFDGHGGKQVSEHCAERIPDEMKNMVLKT